MRERDDEERPASERYGKKADENEVESEGEAGRDSLESRGIGNVKV